MDTNEKPTFSWVRTHKELVQYLATMENRQQELLDLLKSVGIEPLNDKDENNNTIDLQEIDPFTFFCYINKYGPEKRLEFLRKIAAATNVFSPDNESGLPSANPQSVWLFPFKKERTGTEVKKLWSLFYKAVKNEITDSEFMEVRNIKNVGKVKLTEALFYVNPECFLPLDKPVINYLKNELKINPQFESFSEYQSILKQIREKTSLNFYELSYEAWLYQTSSSNITTESVNYWIFQCNPRLFDIEKALIGDLIDSWIVTAHKDRIKPGDKAIIWVVGKHSGCYALAEVTGLPENSTESSDDVYWKTQPEGRLKVPITITHNLVKAPILKEQTLEIDALKEFNAGRQGTNLKSSQKEYEAFKRLAESNIASNNTVSYHLNTILYGPPGTGKTYHTIVMAAEIVTGRKMESYAEALAIFNKSLRDQIEFITFHQNYSYEDFIQGLRPETENSKELIFEKRDGIFKLIADRALKNLIDATNPDKAKKDFDEVFKSFIEPLIQGDKNEVEVKMKKTSFYITGVTDKSIEFRKTSGNSNHTLSISTLKKMYDAESTLNIQGLTPYYDSLLEILISRGKRITPSADIVRQKNYVIIIDEINRANISRVFGELITLIEPDKRSHGAIPLSCILPSGDAFIVPSNLFIIGTMNTADKSIALLDIALRRRFEFEPVYPRYEIPGAVVFEADVLKKLNEQLEKLKGVDFQIGHSYFMANGNSEFNFVERMNRRVIPLLLEYFMNDKEEVVRLLENCSIKLDKKAWPIQIQGKLS